jgi:polyisoprenoid-binding protein YceI
MIRKTLSAAALVLILSSAAQAQTWSIDASHSGAHFAVRHMMVSTVRGDMGKVTGTVNFDGKNLSVATVEATVDATGIDTREPKRDAHLKSADFFDVATYPTITFKSKQVVPNADGSFKIVGDLTLRGVTKEATLNAEAMRPAIKDQGGNTRSGTTATVKINRQDYGVKWSRALDGGGVVVGDEVTITIDVELILPAAAKQ